ncbi:alpha/beta hydrolase [Burkholderia sp. SRS-W-2-2016]|uniref:alpha/beta fold hydrolase n=1 Tax=Burkholderia sp. SRS-W-2-2016 TaxID=1926878 RepID=UPI00094AAC2B|nr:alpha/beta hydrolase [Burkholderia sp. SRS-W-2-2016]OLL29191.1 alpha/beta hydrolase [Burkholderia sp. SRS-W-2-2016]
MENKHREISRRDLLKVAGAVAISATFGNHQAVGAIRPSATLFATDAGAGKNIMFIHGWTCDSHDWSWQLPFFESRYHVVAVDLRGHGKSELMPPGTYAPMDYVTDIEAFIATKYPGQKFIIVGHSMGGQIAARLAAKRPDLVSAVVSVDGALGFTGAAAELFAKVTHDLNSNDPRVVATALFPLVYGRDTDPAFKRWHERRVLGMPQHVVRESFGPLFFGNDQVGIGEASATFCRSLTVPFYHLCRDPAQANRMRSWFSHPKSKVDVWTGAGHWIMQDQSGDVNAAISAWIDVL